MSADAGSQSPRVERVLLAMLVYNGRAFVPRALRSLARLVAHSRGGDGAHVLADALVLDDASPEPGWSDELAALCADLGLGYYRTPRNLGIPRNMNLGLLHGEAAGYDAVVILNSDVILPENLVDGLAAVAGNDPTIASVTAWSNNASIFSLPNDDGDRHLADEPTLDWVSSTLQAEFGAEAIEIPTGVGFCMLIPRHAIETVGVFDPVFGRGYCEEVDWCRRATERGLRNVLAPSAFVYHMGSASTRVAGLLAPGEQTVHTHEDVIDLLRHPDYKGAVAAWEASGPMDAPVERAARRLVAQAAAERGYVLEASWLHRVPEPDADDRVRVLVQPDGPSPLVEAIADGFRCSLPVDGDGILAAVAAFVGCPPGQVRILAQGGRATQLAADAVAAGIPTRNLARYPERV